MSGATLEHKIGVLELTKLEYHKKWYIPIYFPNSVSGQNISIINANGPFCPEKAHIWILMETQMGFSFFMGYFLG